MRHSLRYMVAQPASGIVACLLSAVVFLDVTGISLDHPSDALYELTMNVAEGLITQSAVAIELERIAKSKT